jgi:hypothetical protein
MTADGVEQPDAVARTRGSSVRLLIMTAVLVALVFGAGHAGILPQWVPLRMSLVAPAPATPAVDYPVFGSNELVRHLAANMIAQEDSINVSYWANLDGIGREGVFDAVAEAAIQNPYVFVDGWTYQATIKGIILRPDYVYGDGEAEHKRVETAAAVQVGLEKTGLTPQMSVEKKVRAIHDYVAAVATYDSAAADAITAGATEGPQVEQSQEAYGILVAGTAVCNGYAQAFQALAQAAGVPSVIVTGEASSGVTVGAHAWNRVLVEGEWRVVDVTWDDADSLATQEQYLLVEPGDALLSTRTADHDWVVDAEAAQYGG